MIQKTIERFEPRLQDVRVTQKDLDRRTTERQAGARVLGFQVEAVLVVEPVQEPVVFTTTLDVSRSEFEVKASQ
jgi:predicted component of type VI protein secretion system